MTTDCQPSAVRERPLQAARGAELCSSRGASGQRVDCMQSRLWGGEACWEGPMQEGVGATRASLDFVLDKEGLQLRELFIFERGTDIRKLMF